MDDFMRTYTQLLIAVPSVSIYTTLILLVGAIGLVGPILVNIFFDLKCQKRDVAAEEESLMAQYSLLFRAKMELEKRGESADFEKTRLLAISERLNQIRLDETTN